MLLQENFPSWGSSKRSSHVGDACFSHFILFAADTLMSNLSHIRHLRIIRRTTQRSFLPVKSAKSNSNIKLAWRFIWSGCYQWQSILFYRSHQSKEAENNAIVSKLSNAVEKSFACPECKRTFLFKENLDLHMEWVCFHVCFAVFSLEVTMMSIRSAWEASILLTNQLSGRFKNICVSKCLL